MKKLITILLLSVMTINLIRSQNVVDISQTIEKQIDGEWVLFVNDEKFTGIVLQDWEDKTHEKTYKDGKLNGIYRAYYSNGNLAFLGNLKNGEKQGLCKWYYKNGNLEAKGNYDKGNQVDFHEWYYENGKIKEKSIIKNGEYTSTQKFPENKKIEIRDSLIDSLWTVLDDEIGLGIFYDKWPKVVISETELKNVDGQNIRYYKGVKFTGTVLEYYLNGKRKSSIDYINGKKDVLSQFYYENGNLKEKGSYYKGNKNGQYEWYYENGKVKQKGSFNNGLENGLFEWFYDNGNIWYRVSYEYGERNGYYTEFHLNGNLRWKGIFRDDNYDGEWIEYDSTGKVIQELNYKNGKIFKQN